MRSKGQSYQRWNHARGTWQKTGLPHVPHVGSLSLWMSWYLSATDRNCQRELVCFTCLLRCIDHTNVISKLEELSTAVRTAKAEVPVTCGGMEHRAGKHQAISVTHTTHQSAAWASDRFHGLVLATWYLLIIYPYVPGRAHSYGTVGVFHFLLYCQSSKKSGTASSGKEPNILLHMCMC